MHTMHIVIHFSLFNRLFFSYLSVLLRIGGKLKIEFTKQQTYFLRIGMVFHGTGADAGNAIDYIEMNNAFT